MAKLSLRQPSAPALDDRRWSRPGRARAPASRWPSTSAAAGAGVLQLVVRSLHAARPDRKAESSCEKQQPEGWRATRARVWSGTCEQACRYGAVLERIAVQTVEGRGLRARESVGTASLDPGRVALRRRRGRRLASHAEGGRRAPTASRCAARVLRETRGHVHWSVLRQFGHARRVLELCGLLQLCPDVRGYRTPAAA